MTRLREKDAEQRRLAGVGPDFSEALARGLQVIGVFAQTLSPLSLADVARAVDLPKATVRRALRTLVHLGYVELEGRLFRVTPQILCLANAYLVSNMVSTVLQPACERLTRETGHSCATAVLDRGDVVMIARAIPAQAIAIGVGIGFRLPALSTSLGRVLLAALPDEAIERHLASGVVAETEHTVTDVARLRRILRQVRKAGYAYVDQEAESGFRSVAVPVRRFDKTVVAALHLGSRTDRVSEQLLIERDLKLLQQCASDLERQLL